MADLRNWSNTAASKQGRVVIPGLLDRDLLQLQKENSDPTTRLYPSASLDDKVLGVMPGEILLVQHSNVLNNSSTIGRRPSKRRKMRIKNPEPECISKVNGLKVVPLNNADQLSKVEIAKRTLRFAGISNTAYHYDSKYADLQKTGLALQLGGVVSIINTGDQNIRQWDKICWDLPAETVTRGRQYAGIDKRALAVRSVPYDASNYITFENCVNMLERNGDNIVASRQIGNTCKAFCANFKQFINDLQGGGTDVEKFKKMKHLFYTMGLCHQEQSERIIGTALSSAGKYEQFDIYLGKYM